MVADFFDFPFSLSFLCDLYQYMTDAQAGLMTDPCIYKELFIFISLLHFTLSLTHTLSHTLSLYISLSISIQTCLSRLDDLLFATSIFVVSQRVVMLLESLYLFSSCSCSCSCRLMSSHVVSCRLMSSHLVVFVICLFFHCLCYLSVSTFVLD